MLESDSARDRIEQSLKNFALALGHSIAEDGEFWAIVIPLLVCGFILFVIGITIYEVVLDVHATTTATLDSLSINPRQMDSALTLARRSHPPVDLDFE